MITKKSTFRIIFGLLLALGTMILAEGAMRIYKRVGFDTSRDFYKRYRITPDETYWTEILAPLRHDSKVPTYIRYDSLLGWSIRPESRSANSLYRSNAAGIRASREYSQLPDSSVIRIAVFGDSFTHGDQVADHETWSTYLQKQLTALGITNEVLNFGVPGYGVDQAYLRWLNDGRAFRPDIVIAGLQLENFFRNLNVFRPNYQLYSGIPLTKPRAFVENDSLHWFNRPTIKPDRLVDLILADNHPEVIFGKENYQFHDLFHASEGLYRFYLFKYIRKFWHPWPSYQLNITGNNEGKVLMKKLLEEFRGSVEKSGARFLVLHLPVGGEVRARQQQQPQPYGEYRKELLQGFDHCSTLTELARYHKKDIFKHHYTPLGNQTIASILADFLINSDLLPERKPGSTGIHRAQLTKRYDIQLP